MDPLIFYRIYKKLVGIGFIDYYIHGRMHLPLKFKARAAIPAIFFTLRLAVLAAKSFAQS